MKKAMRRKSKCSVQMIAGSDGPTSVFVAGRTYPRNIFRDIKNAWRKKKHQRKKEKILSQLKAEPHSLEDVVVWLFEHYPVTEIGRNHRRAEEGYRNVKAALVQRYASELLGTPLEELRPADFSDREAVTGYLDVCREYQEKAEKLSDEIFPMDYHFYEVRLEGCGEMQVEIDFVHQFFGAGYTARKGSRKEMQRVLKDVYLYYGVAQEDIEKYSERMQSLVAVLTAD